MSYIYLGCNYPSVLEFDGTGAIFSAVKAMLAKLSWGTGTQMLKCTKG